MNPEKLQAIADRSAENLRALIMEMADEIGNAITAATEQAEEDEKETIIITLSHSIKLDLGKNRQADSLSVAARTKRTAEGEIPDPNQPELEI